METHRLALAAGYRLEHFQIVRILGKGGFGITYEAIDLQLSKKVAIKELLPDSIATRVEGSTVVPQTSSMEESWGWAKERFLEEARFLAGFSHPAIVGVHRLIEANGTVYMVMDFVEGESYEARLRRIGKEPDQASIMAVMGPIMEGVEEIHAKNLLHRDIKPDNILIDKRGNPVLIDFGSARMSVGATMTMTSMVTHGYSPIEQYQTKGRMGPWTDIYAIGAVMCRAITGEKPPVAADRVLDDDFEWVSNRKPVGYDETFLNAVDWALRVRVEDRPQSVAAFTQLIAVKPSTTAPPPVPTPPQVKVEPASVVSNPTPKKEKNNNLKGFLILAIAVSVPVFYFISKSSNSDDYEKKQAQFEQPAPSPNPTPYKLKNPKLSDLWTSSKLTRFGVELNHPSSFKRLKGAWENPNFQGSLSALNTDSISDGVMNVKLLYESDDFENSWQNELKRNGSNITYKVKKNDWYVISGVKTGGIEFYRKVWLIDSWCFSFEATYPNNLNSKYDPILERMLNGFKPIITES